jgi:hypothetical protein
MRFEARYARFENLNDSAYFDEGNPSAMTRYNQESGTMTIQSKMNQGDVTEFLNENKDEVPF